MELNKYCVSVCLNMHIHKTAALTKHIHKVNIFFSRVQVILNFEIINHLI